VLLLSGCGGKEILFFTDPYLDFQMRIDDNFHEKKARFEREHDINVSIIVIEQSGAALEEMKRYIAERDPYGIVASYFLRNRLMLLLSEDQAEAAPVPHAAVLGSEKQAAADLSSVVSVSFDARDAFKRAGAEAGEFLLSTETGAADSMAGLFFLHPDAETGAAEEQACSAGLQSSGLPLSRIRSYGAAEVNEERLNSAVSAMRGEGVRLFVVNAYEWNPFLMRLLKDDETAVVRNYSVQLVYPSRILCSVNDDMFTALEGIYEAFQSEKTGTIMVESVFRKIQAEK
jgi:hypothetical protein